ncbi:sensor histidine kinase [Streptomyces sp. CA-111067]|uniref:sensor histidine kinase n=1 Tax=Streptomyces sp. CA-111067 TaxID=3240046 RepID=UPI003D97A4C3
MRDAARTFRAWVRRPPLQDAALACGLLVACLLVNDPFALVRTQADGTGDSRWSGPGVVWVWWTATALTAACVALRRCRPVPMLVVCALSTVARVGVGVLPTVMDLAVPVLLYTVAARCPRPMSLPALAGLLLAAAWLIGGWPAEQPLRIPTSRVCARHVAAPEPALAGSTWSTWSTRSTGSAGPACEDDDPSPWRALPVLGSVLVAAWAVGAGNRSRRAYLEQLHARAEDLERERDHEAALAVAEERALRLHDVVAHGLSLIVVQAQGADAALDNHPADTRTALRTIITAGRDSLADMRRVLAALGEPDDPWQAQPGLARLPGLLTRVRQAGTPVHLRIEGTSAALPAAVDLSAYRIVQEALTNVMKHAGAGAAAGVVVSYGATEVAVEVYDDGVGVVGGGSDAGSDAGTGAASGMRAGAGLAGTGAAAGPGPGGSGGTLSGISARGGTGTGTDPGPGPGTAPVGGGNGLPGMRRRVALLGGHFSAGPADRGGFVVRAGLPIHAGGGRSG